MQHIERSITKDNNMIVKITKCGDKGYWYASMVGCHFMVEPSKDINDWRVTDYKHGYVIGKDDCIIVEDINNDILNTPWLVEKIAVAEGKIIERLDCYGDWIIVTKPDWSSSAYRVRRTPICTVENKPVYAGDKLYNVYLEKFVTIKCADSNPLHVTTYPGSSAITSLRWEVPKPDSVSYLDYLPEFHEWVEHDDRTKFSLFKILRDGSTNEIISKEVLK